MGACQSRSKSKARSGGRLVKGKSGGLGVTAPPAPANIQDAGGPGPRRHVAFKEDAVCEAQESRNATSTPAGSDSNSDVLVVAISSFEEKNAPAAASGAAAAAHAHAQSHKSWLKNAPSKKTMIAVPTFHEPEAPVFDQRSGLHPQFQALLEDEDYRKGASLDHLRATEYAQLNAHAHTYLDFTGGGLACGRQLQRLFEFLQKNVLGNPHSMNPTSNFASSLETGARNAVRSFFNVPDDYAVVFTANASGALRIVGECYAFGPGVPFLLSADNHNSVGGIREFARAKGSSVTYVPLTDELFTDEDFLARALQSKPAGQHGLFAYPAQSNVSGVKHPLSYIVAAREAGWDVLLDASAFVPTSSLDVSKWRPDFVAMSFYKMFGFPTGIGCLLIRHGAAGRLRKPYFAGGTVAFATQRTQFHILRPELQKLHAVFEDGTVSYQTLPGVTIGLEFLGQHLTPLKHRLFAIMKHVMPAMAALRHPRTGRPLVRLFGPGPDPDMEARRRGATLVFNLFDADGKGIVYGLVEQLAAERGISLRTGCFCNPGVMEAVLGVSEEAMLEIERRWGAALASGAAAAAAAAGDSDFDKDELFGDLIPPERRGAVRVSFGITSTAMDASRLLHFLEEFLDEAFVARERRKFAEGGAPAH